MIMSEFRRGTQVMRAPDWAKDDDDTEYGFVMSVVNIGAFCRYWSNVNPDELRTKSCSELTLFDDLTLHDSKPQEYVDRVIAAIKQEAS